MSARHRSPKHLAAKPRRFRLASMETLGFTDNPTANNTWTNRPVQATTVITAPPPVAEDDLFTAWAPNEYGRKLKRKSIRWSVVITTGLAAIVLVTIGYWLFRQPQIAAQQAQADLTSSANELQTSLAAISQIDLIQDVEAANAATSSVNSAARSLFNLSGTLPDSLSAERLVAADAAGRALTGSRLLEDTYAYRSAVIPILALPQLETNPELIEMDEAVRSFGIWRSRFEDLAPALPAGLLEPVGAALMDVSAQLEDLQRAYLDGLRSDDAAAASAAVTEVSGMVAEVESLLATEVENAIRLAEEEFALAGASLARLLG